MLINTITKAYSYIRFSSPAQAEGDSLRRQIERSQKYAAEHGLTLDTTLDLNDEGLSGYTGANRTKGALGMFLAAVESGIVAPGSSLLVESLDRLSRDKVTEQLNLFLSLITANITIVTLIDGQVYSRETIDSDHTKLIISLVTMMRAHDESKHKSDRLLSVWAAKRNRADQQKLTAQCPAWLTLAKDRKTFEKNEERVAVLRRIYDMSNEGIGHHRIAQILNTERVPHWGERITPMLSLASFNDPGAFARKLRSSKDPVSEFVVSKLPDSAKAVIAAWPEQGELPEDTKARFVMGLNQIIKQERLFDPARFAGVPVRAKAEKMLHRDRELRPKELARLNRMLMEDAFPNDIRPGNGWHESFVLALLRTRAVLGEFQPHRRERAPKRRAIPVGDPIPDYFPQVIDYEIWQRAQSRRRTSTPGRTGAHVPNLFAGLAWDANSGAAMRFVSRSPRRDAAGRREGRWHYLSSDFARLKKGAKARSWRYEWLETWFLSSISQLDWGAVAKQRVPAAEKALASKLAKLTQHHEDLDQQLERLMALGKSTNNPPKRLLEEMSAIEAKKLETETELRTLQREANEAAARRAALNESVDQIKELVAKGDPNSRLRLREELRRKISRIDVYCDGVPGMETEGVVSAPAWPGFAITFGNGVRRLVLCPGKKPTESNADVVIMDSWPEGTDEPEIDYTSEETVLELLKTAENRNSPEPAPKDEVTKTLPLPSPTVPRETTLAAQQEFFPITK